MKSTVDPSRVYKDIEKMFRLLSLYKGNREPLEAHLKIIDQRLNSALRSGSSLENSGVQFDFLMGGVTSQGTECFHSSQPETTLAYALFCEGVKAITLTKDVTAEDLLDWTRILKKHFDNTNTSEDLASLLWKNPHPHIRVYLYNALLEVSSVGGGLEAQEGGDVPLVEEIEGGRKDGSGDGDVPSDDDIMQWHERDSWELPSGNLIMREIGKTDDLDADRVARLREELSDASVSDRVQSLVRFSDAELSLLRQEMESFDQNHVEFNMLVRDFEIVRDSKSYPDSVVLQSVLSIKKIAATVVERFHGGLLVFLLKRLDSLKSDKALESHATEIRDAISKSLSQPENLRQVAEAFSTPTRMTIAKQLMEYVRRTDWPYLFDLLNHSKTPQGLNEFLKSVLEIDFEGDQYFFQWGDDRLMQLISPLANLSWERRERFLWRAITYRSPHVAEVALAYITGVTPSAEAITVFQRLNSRGKRLWAEGLNARIALVWKPLVVQVFQNGLWIDSQFDTMLAWIKVGFNYLGQDCFRMLDPYVKARKMVFWPKFPQERDAALTAALQLKENNFRSFVTEWAEREKSVMFQDLELKEKLKARGSR